MAKDIGLGTKLFWLALANVWLLCLPPAANTQQGGPGNITDKVKKILESHLTLKTADCGATPGQDILKYLAPNDATWVDDMRGMKDDLSKLQDKLPGQFNHTYDPAAGDGIFGQKVRFELQRNRLGQAQNADCVNGTRGAKGQDGFDSVTVLGGEVIAIVVGGNGGKGGDGCQIVRHKEDDPFAAGDSLLPGGGGSGGFAAGVGFDHKNSLVALGGDGGAAGDAGFQLDRTVKPLPGLEVVASQGGISGRTNAPFDNATCNGFAMLSGRGGNGSDLNPPDKKQFRLFPGGTGGDGGEGRITANPTPQFGRIKAGDGGRGGVVKGGKQGPGGKGGNVERIGAGAAMVAGKAGTGGPGDPKGQDGAVAPPGNTF